MTFWFSNFLKPHCIHNLLYFIHQVLTLCRGCYWLLIHMSEQSIQLLMCNVSINALPPSQSRILRLTLELRLKLELFVFCPVAHLALLSWTQQLDSQFPCGWKRQKTAGGRGTVLNVAGIKLFRLDSFFHARLPLSLSLPVTVCLHCCSVPMLSVSLFVRLSIRGGSLIDAHQILYTSAYSYWTLQWVEGTRWRIFSPLREALSFVHSLSTHTHTMKRQPNHLYPFCAVPQSPFVYLYL